MEKADLLTAFLLACGYTILCVCVCPCFFLEETAFLSKAFLIWQRLFLLELNCPEGSPNSMSLVMHCDILNP